PHRAPRPPRRSSDLAPQRDPRAQADRDGARGGRRGALVMALIEIGRYVAGFEADLDRLRLEDAGIYAFVFDSGMGALVAGVRLRSEEHTSELQSREN